MKQPHEIFLEKVMSRRRFGIKPGLETISNLMRILGNPERDLKFIHVAGTNGKGATCAILESVLYASGFKTARYTSPHLISINERFSINTRPVDDELLAEAANEVIPAIEKLESDSQSEITFFECLTAIAFVLFKKSKCDIVVLETGLGGAFDATNIIPSESLLSAVITRIGLDHCDWLGATIPEIAREKAGIIKKDRPLVLGNLNNEAKEVILNIAKEKNAQVSFASPTMAIPKNFSLKGEFQKENARSALTTLNTLRDIHKINIPESAIEKGFSSVVWPGRCQHIIYKEHLFIVDGAHNPDAALALKDALSDVQRPLALIAGFCGDKDALGHLKIMSEIVTQAYAVEIRNERTLSAQATSRLMNDAGIKSEALPSLDNAIEKALSWMEETNGATVICGSLFLVAEALQNLNAFPYESTRLDENEKCRV
jgi:dihydrofolate synthase/folylpolyglutamate synthase